MITHVRRPLCTLGLAAACLAAAPAATAADTVEPWSTGAADVDHYVGYDGIGLDRADRSVYGDMMLGWGVGHNVSAYLGTTLSANGYLTGQSADPYLGIHVTPLETDHVDLDLFLDFSQGDDALQIAPAFELNLDTAQDLAAFGVYVRTAVPIYGRTSADDPDAPGETAMHIEPLFGAYKTFGDHQVLVELDMAIRPDAVEGERETEVGGVALGWNIGLSDTLEIINQVAVDIPQDGEDVSFGVSTGFIATLERVQPQ